MLMAVPGPPVFDDPTREKILDLMGRGAAGGIFLTTDDCQAAYEELKAPRRGVQRGAASSARTGSTPASTTRPATPSGSSSRPPAAIRPPSIRPISSTQPAFASGSLRLPHFGDCTHYGQPFSHGHSRHEPVGVADERLELVVAPAGDADPAGVAVVDEDRRAAGLRVVVRRQAADVPAVAHREQRQDGDLACSAACRAPSS